MSVLFVLSLLNANAADVHVGSGQTHATVAAAVSAANANDTIIIHEGTYTEGGPITVNKTLTIENNDSLTSLDGFSSLSELESDLDVIQNPILEEVDGMSALQYIGGDVLFEDNYELCYSAVSALLNDVEIEGQITLRDLRSAGCY